MEQQEMLQSIFEEATVGIVVVNIKGEIVAVNPFAKKLFGYKEEELLHQPIEVLLPVSFRTNHVKYRQHYHQKPTPRLMGANLDLYGQRKDGKQFPVEISLSSMLVNEKRLSIAYISDDTAQRTMTKNLKESKERLDEAQSLGHVGSFEYRLADNRIFWSDEMYRIFGLEPQSTLITYERHFDFIHPHDRQKVADLLTKMRAEKKGLEFGYRIICPSRGLRYLKGKRKIKLDENGEVSTIFGLIQDVTEEQIQKEELEKAQTINEDISRIVEESLNEIFIFDATTFKFVQVNHGARKNIGYSLEEIQQITPIDIKPEYTEHAFKKMVKPLLVGAEEKLQFETIHQRKDQTIYPVEVHLQYSKIGDQPVFVAIILDITERKKSEQAIRDYSLHLEQKVTERTEELAANELQLKEALKKEQELGQLKSRFVSMASHEFRTPLSSILSSADLIGLYEKEEQQNKRMKHVNRIVSSVKNLTTILNDFLSLEKLETGNVRYNPVQIEVHSYIESVLDEMNGLKAKNHLILFEHSGTPEIIADEHLLKNILINLLSNAIKYSPSHKAIKLRTKRENACLIIEVIDHGIGIPKADQSHMFTRFFRATNVENIQGTGLGLTIVKRYLDLMNGTISFKSKENVGTTFRIEIPH